MRRALGVGGRIGTADDAPTPREQSVGSRGGRGAHRRWCAALLLVSQVAPAWGHHSFAALNMDQTLALSGTLRDFEWGNPHTRITLATTTAAGGTIDVQFEGAPPASLTRDGWKPDTVKPGDHLTVEYHPWRDGRSGGGFIAVTLPNGRHLTTTGAQPPRPLPSR